MIEYLGIVYTQMNNSWTYYVNGSFAWANGSVVSILDALYYGS
jgi:hypothetical protein